MYILYMFICWWVSPEGFVYMLILYMIYYICMLDLFMYYVTIYLCTKLKGSVYTYLYIYIYIYILYMYICWCVSPEGEPQHTR